MQTQPADRGHVLPGVRWRDHRADLVLAVGVLVQILPLLVLPLVLTVDGPAHLSGAWIVAHYDDPGAGGLRTAFDLHLGLVPNLLETIVLGALLHVVGPDAAERIVAVAVVAGLPWALRYALRAIDPRAGWLAVGALPFASAYLFQYGFYNFCAGICLALVAIGIALGARPVWSWRRAVALAVVLALTWTAHLLPLLVAGMVVALLGIARCSAAVAGGLRARTAVARHVGPPALAAVPVVLATTVFLTGGGGHRGTAVWGSWTELALGLLTLFRPLVVLGWLELLPAAVTATALVALAVASRRRRGTSTPAVSPERWALGVAGVVAVALYLVLPDHFGSEYGFLNDRMAYVPPLLLILWTAAGQRSPQALTRAVAGTLVIASVALVALRLPTQVRDQRLAAEYLSVSPAVTAGATVVTLSYAATPPLLWPVRSHHLDPLRHESSRLAVRADAVDVGLYEAVFDYFQVRWAGPDNPRSSLDPTFRGLERTPPRVDLTGADPSDFVVVLGLDRASVAVRTSSTTQRVLAELRAHYRLVTTSRPTGLAQVWERQSSG